MALPANLLDPIPGDNPAGKDLRYAPVYDKIKEARREDDTAEQGDWKHEIKKADWIAVVKLATEALSKQSKDLQLAAWLTEALLRKEGIGGLNEGLNLLKSLLETFWDNVYPELEDGDAELRATPLEWVGMRLDEGVRRVPLTKSGLDWFKYKESRAVGYEANATSDAQRTARETAIADGKMTGELFDEAYNATPTPFYQKLVADCDAALETVNAVSELADAKFGKVAPSFGNLRTALEEVRHSARALLEPRGPKEAVPEGVAEAEPEVAVGEEAAGGARARGGLSPEPADRDDAVSRIIVVANWLRKQESSSPAPYMILRGLRWGELRAGGTPIDQRLLEAPSTELRTQIKAHSLDSNWTGVLDAAETAMGQPCGRGWLDLQRYVYRACEAQGDGFTCIAQAVCSELRGLLTDYPQLAQMTLMDDTPTANPETQEWLRSVVIPTPLEAPPMQQSTEQATQPALEEEGETAPGVEKPPDAYELASQALRSGRLESAVEILAREISQERSGRARFRRKIQLAGICMAGGSEAVAYPILQEMYDEIERRRLEEWEAPELVAQPLLLLLRCMDKLGHKGEERQKLYARICRLDPRQALECAR